MGATYLPPPKKDQREGTLQTPAKQGTPEKLGFGYEEAYTCGSKRMYSTKGIQAEETSVSYIASKEKSISRKK